MNREQLLTPEHEAKEAWVVELSHFIVEANINTWAAEGAEVEPERPGYQELEYKKGLWRLRDSYTGYFRAPGMTTVYYKDTPAWNMQYGGHGMTEGYEDRAKATFNFLKSALMKVTPELPYRGPLHHQDGDYNYDFRLLNGDIMDCLWEEKIREKGMLTFTQTGMAGIIIPRDASKKPRFPWNL